MWSVVDDRDGNVVATGTEAQAKLAYFSAISSGVLPEMEAFIEDAEGNQFAWNKHTSTWDEL